MLGLTVVSIVASNMALLVRFLIWIMPPDTWEVPGLLDKMYPVLRGQSCGTDASCSCVVRSLHAEVLVIATSNVRCCNRGRPLATFGLVAGCLVRAGVAICTAVGLRSFVTVWV
jgi:hypothetical protein